MSKTVAEREGYTRYYTKGHGEGWTLAASCYPALMEAWKAGRAFYDGVDCFGDNLSVKLADVVTVALCTPEGMERWQEDEDIRKQRELLSGEV